MSDYQFQINEVLELPLEQIQEYIQKNLMGLSELNMDRSVLMTGYENIADGVSFALYGMNPTTHTPYLKSEDYNVLGNVIDRMCQQGQLSWHAVNAAHAANVVALEKKAKLTLTERGGN